MGALRERMVREMQLREFSASTQKLYLATVMDLARYHHRAPDALDGTQVQDDLLYHTRERPLASSSVSVAASAIRFFYTQTVKRPEIAMAIPPRRKRAASAERPGESHEDSPGFTPESLEGLAPARGRPWRPERRVSSGRPYQESAMLHSRHSRGTTRIGSSNVAWSVHRALADACPDRSVPAWSLAKSTRTRWARLTEAESGKALARG